MVKKGKRSNKKKKGGKKGAAHGAVDTADEKVVGTDGREKVLLDELRVRTRSLLSSMKGVAPDGSPFSSHGKRHSLALLFESNSVSTEELILVQRKKLAEAKLSSAEKEGESDCERVEKKNIIESACADNRDNANVWDHFREWLSQCNIEPNERGFPVEIRKTPNGSAGFGLFATRDIDYGETILEIPVPAMVCPYFDHCLAEDTCVPPPPFDPSRPREEDQSMRPLCLVMFIVNEQWKGTKSTAHQYLHTLPASYSTPLYWSLESVLEMKNTAHLKRAVSLQTITMWEYLQMRDLVKQAHAQAADRNDGVKLDLIPLESFDYESFRWATAAAHTRQNLIPFLERSQCNDEAKSAPAAKTVDVQHAFGMIPLWDMMNHEDSDRACKSDVSMLDPDHDTGGEKSPCQGFLTCRTPMPPSSAAGQAENDNEPCFRKDEEVKMYYGDRSSAQLLFHSGFVNGGPREGGNWNRNDHTVIRVALPNSEIEPGLDRIREMVAARFGFRAYGDQGDGGVDRHDGLALARAAASVLGGEHRTSRSEAEVLMTDDISLSPGVAFSDELKRALLLCVADRDELAHLMRNAGRYMAPPGSSEENDPETGTDGKGDGLLDMSDKHLRLMSKIVDVWKERYGTSKQQSEVSDCSEPSMIRDGIWLDPRHCKKLVNDLSYCDQITLERWFDKFRSQF